MGSVTAGGLETDLGNVSPAVTANAIQLRSIQRADLSVHHVSNCGVTSLSESKAVMKDLNPASIVEAFIRMMMSLFIVACGKGCFLLGDSWEAS